jgi:hypothetical protein
VGTKVAEPLSADIVPQVRLLIRFPLPLLADVVVDAATRATTRTLEISGVVPAATQTRFKAALTNCACAHAPGTPTANPAHVR